MADPSPMGRYDALQSYETRGPTLHESDDSVTLGQKNSDSTSTRTKITQVELGSLGIIGTVLSVTYGTWDAKPAACITLRFDFRCKDGQFRFGSSEIGVSFTAFPQAQVGKGSTPRLRTKNINSPVVVFFYPQDHKLPSPTVSEKSSVGDDTGRTQPRFSLKGRTWSKTTRDEPHQVFWTMHEDAAAKSGISDAVCLCIVVRHLGSFQATVEARAKLTLGVTLRNLPWSEDDPLLFDGVTGKGPQLEIKEYDSLAVENWTEWLSRFTRIGSSTSSLCSVRGTAGATQDAKTVRDEMAYRVRAIPKNWSETYFLDKLTALFQMGHCARDIRVLSFAPSAFPLRQEKSAVISFSKGAPQVLSDEKQRWVLEVPEDPSADEAGRVELVFDLTFDGLTPLGKNATAPGSPASADIIVVPGLGGHAYGSFKERGGPYMWLQDSLAKDIQPMATTAGPIRVLTYGYESRVAESHSFQTLWDLGGKLQASIREIRQAKRPLILIAHSLGGLVVKEAIIRMSMGDQKDQDNLRCIVGALFFGVPSKGMDTNSLIPMAGDQPNRPLLDSISTGSSLLQKQSQKFEERFPFRDSSIISFHELRLSPTAVHDGSKWTMTGPPAVLVDPESATNGRAWETSSPFVLGLDRNHSDLVKFNPSCDDYELVLGSLRDVLSDGERIISSRFS